MTGKPLLLAQKGRFGEKVSTEAETPRKPLAPAGMEA